MNTVKSVIHDPFRRIGMGEIWRMAACGAKQIFGVR
jgi:hypothetical protein